MEFNYGISDNRVYKIQEIVCKACAKVVGGRLVRLSDEDHDYCFCFWCLESICSVGEVLNAKNFPTRDEVNKVRYRTETNVAIGFNVRVEDNLRKLL